MAAVGLAGGLALATVATRVAAEAPAQEKVRRLSAKQLNALEAQADGARRAFFEGRYDAAAQGFKPLVAELHASRPLYLCEMGVCRLGSGDYPGAKENLLSAAEYLETYFDPKLERRAGSLFGAETVKVYKGDPYERAMNALLLGLLFLNDNDVDNALACFKNAGLADSDVAQDTYKSDFAMLQALEAKCYQLRGEPSMFEQSAAQARRSFTSTHPLTRQAAAEREQIAAAQQQASKTRQRGKQPDFAEQLAAADRRVESIASTIPMDLASRFVDGDYNTLVVVWSGRAPTKSRAGQYGERSFLVLNRSRENRYEIGVDAAEPAYDGIDGVADINFQATTRGGRQMDNILKSQADVKAFTSGLGDALISSADDVGGYAGLAMLAVGLVSKGVSAATNAEADVRHWQCLPGALLVAPLKLPPGKHELVVEGYYGFLAAGTRKRTIEVPAGDGVTVVFVLPDAVAATAALGQTGQGQ
jgi:hypothetical protein